MAIHFHIINIFPLNVLRWAQAQLPLREGGGVPEREVPASERKTWGLERDEEGHLNPRSPLQVGAKGWTGGVINHFHRSKMSVCDTCRVSDHAGPTV